MKSQLFLISICLLALFPVFGNAVVDVDNQTISKLSEADWGTKQFINFKKKAIEKQLDRKLKWKEKIAVRFLKSKAKKRKKAASKNGEKKKTDGFAASGFFFGVVGFIGLIGFSGGLAILIALLTGVSAIILSAIGLKRLRRDPEKKKGKFLALAGLFLGSILLLVSILGGYSYLM